MDAKSRGREIKREILLSLLVILIFLTIVGTWTVLEALEDYKFDAAANVVYEPGGEDDSGGKVSLTIIKPDELKEEG